MVLVSKFYLIIVQYHTNNVQVELVTRRKVGEDVRRGPETHYRVDEALLRAYAPKDTPPNLLDLTLQCCAYDSNIRPSFIDIHPKLTTIVDFT